MSEEHAKVLQETGKISSIGETFITESKEYASNYNGVTVEFETNNGTKNMLESIGVKNDSKITNKLYPNMPLIDKDWGQTNAYFKGEDNVKELINIGLGKGNALEIFNENIVSFKIIGR